MSNSEKDRLLLSNKCSLRKQQLKAFAFMNVHTMLSHFSTSHQVDEWNKMPIEVRNSPRLIVQAVRGWQHYRYSYGSSMSAPNVAGKVQTFLWLDSIVLNPGSLEKKEPRMTMFTWLCKHKQYFLLHCRYDIGLFIKLLQQPTLSYGGKKFVQNFTVTSTVDELLPRWEELVIAASYIKRSTVGRQQYQEQLANQYEQSGCFTSVREKLVRNIQFIQTIHPMHWSTQLQGVCSKIANRLRPMGDCNGIELEFLSTTDGDISRWSEDDFPTDNWLNFKTDSSINANHDNEQRAYFQELTFFMNHNSERDWEIIKKTLNQMTASGAIVNNTCGCHVHIDMRDRTAASAMRTATKVRDSINDWAHRLVSYKRSHNTYCGINAGSESSRYTAVNTQCWSEHRTIEVRLGMPTLNYHKLRYWTRFLRWLAQPNTRVATLDDFMQSNAPMDLKVYAFNRILKFNGTYTTRNLPELPGFNEYVKAFQSLNVEYYGNSVQGGADSL